MAFRLLTAVRPASAGRRAVCTRAPILIEVKANARWSLDFVHDQFACGRRFRVLNVVDEVTRECLAAIPDTLVSGRRAMLDFEALAAATVTLAGIEVVHMMRWRQGRFAFNPAPSLKEQLALLLPQLPQTGTALVPFKDCAAQLL